MASFDLFFGSHLVDGVILGSAALILFAVLRNEVRVRPSAWWINDKVVYIFFAPFITVLNAAAAVFIVYGLGRLSSQPLSWQELAAVGVSLALAATVWIWLSPPAPERSSTTADKVRSRTVTAHASAGG